MSGIEHAVYTIVSEGIAMAYTVCIPAHAADVTVIVATVSQGLCELGAADTCQPVLDIITISQLVRAASMQLLGGYASEGVIRIVPFIILLARRISNQI